MKSFQCLVGEKTCSSVGNYSQQRWTEAAIKCPQAFFVKSFYKNFPERSIPLNIKALALKKLKLQPKRKIFAPIKA